MSHLTETQFVDVLEGRSTERLSSHLASCQACRVELVTLGEALGLARSVEIPEPSPLFWEHFSRRVRAATSDEVIHAAPSWSEVWARAWRPLAAVVVAGGVLVVMLVFRSAHVSAPGPTEATASVNSAGAIAPEVGTEEALSVVAIIAEDLRADELQQVAPPSADATGAAIEELTPAQRAALVQLIKTQAGGPE